VHFFGSDSSNQDGFSFTDVCCAIGVCLVFGVAVFTTNQRLLISLKSQKETTAATMMLQERMEMLRSFGFTDLAKTQYVENNLFNQTTTSENVLGNFTEYLTVSSFLSSAGVSGNYPTDGSHANKWRRTSAGFTQLDSDSNLATNNDLLRVDLVLSWTSANGRTRTRQLSSVFGKGNVSP